MSLEREVRTQLRVRYAETDAQRIAYHANFIVWFEVARGDYLRAIGFDYNRMEDEGAFVVVAELHAKYLAPVRYDDQLTIVSRISELRSRSLRFEYRVYRGEQLAAEGWTAHVVVNQEGRPVVIPEDIRRAIEAPDAGSFQGDAVTSPIA